MSDSNIRRPTGTVPPVNARTEITASSAAAAVTSPTRSSSAAAAGNIGQVADPTRGHDVQALNLASLGVTTTHSSALATNTIPVDSISTAAGSRRTSGAGLSSASAEANAVLEQAMRENEVSGNDNFADLRQQVLYHHAVRTAIRAEQDRARDALRRIRELPPGALLNPPFVPNEIKVEWHGANQSTATTMALPESMRLTIDGTTLDIPRSIYTQVGFSEALAALHNVRALPATTGGAQGCGAGVKNELVSNAFQFLATNAALRTVQNGSFDHTTQTNANLDYSDFVAALEEYGISATANQADGVGGGSVTLEGGRKVSDGVSDGNLDFKDLEWKDASTALAGAIGIEVGDLFSDAEVFHEEYTQISALLEDNDFNPADNDALVEVLMIASMIEHAGEGSEITEGGLFTRSDIEAYVNNLDDLARSMGGVMGAHGLELAMQFLTEGNSPVYADLGQSAAGTTDTEANPQSGSGNNTTPNAGNQQTGRGVPGVGTGASGASGVTNIAAGGIDLSVLNDNMAVSSRSGITDASGLAGHASTDLRTSVVTQNRDSASQVANSLTPDTNLGTRRRE